MRPVPKPSQQHKHPKPPPQPKEKKHKKPGPDSPYAIMHETRVLARAILKELRGQNPHDGGLTPPQLADLNALERDMQQLIETLDHADQPTTKENV